MNYYVGKIIALRTQADQCNARIAAMKAANQISKLKGEEPKYNWQSFMEEANELGDLASRIEALAQDV
jgi:hypothetical protein